MTEVLFWCQQNTGLKGTGHLVVGDKRQKAKLALSPPCMACNRRRWSSLQSPRGIPRFQNHTSSLCRRGRWEYSTASRRDVSPVAVIEGSARRLSPREKFFKINCQPLSVNYSRCSPKMLSFPALARGSFSLDQMISRRICRCSCPWLPCISRRRPRGTWRRRTGRCKDRQTTSSIYPGPWVGASSLCCSQLQLFSEISQDNS